MNQLELIPSTVETPWTPGERRRLRGLIGRATLQIDLRYTGQFFRWSGQFDAPSFGTGLPESAQNFSSAGSAFGAATGVIRAWLERNGQDDWRRRLDRWLESKTISDFQKIDPTHDNARAHARDSDRAGRVSPLRS